jgi:hypothetical protein
MFIVRHRCDYGAYATRNTIADGASFCGMICLNDGREVFVRRAKDDTPTLCRLTRQCGALGEILMFAVAQRR